MSKADRDAAPDTGELRDLSRARTTLRDHPVAWPRNGHRSGDLLREQRDRILGA